MAGTRDLPLAAQIDLVEARMALRRARLATTLEATRAEAQRATEKAMRWLPLAGAAGALAVGFMAARHRRAAKTSPPRGVAPAPASPPVRKGLLATLLALALGTLRFATSAEGRMAWRAFETARARAQRRRGAAPGA